MYELTETVAISIRPDKSQHGEGEVITKSHPLLRSYLQLVADGKGRTSLHQHSDNENVNHTPWQALCTGVIDQHKIGNRDSVGFGCFFLVVVIFIWFSFIVAFYFV